MKLNTHRENMISEAAQQYALGAVLSEWPDKTYDEVIDLIKNGDDIEITVWEQFEDDSTEQVIEAIRSEKRCFENKVRDLIIKMK